MDAPHAFGKSAYNNILSLPGVNCKASEIFYKKITVNTKEIR
jgi:hypothetical protein